MPIKGFLTLIGHDFVHATAGDGLDEAEVTSSQHLLLKGCSLVVVLCRPRQNLKNCQHQWHEDLLQERRHLALQVKTQIQSNGLFHEN